MAGTCAILLYVIRRQNNLMAEFSICAILAMYWSYSRHYDLVLFAIPLTQLLLPWETKRSKAAALAFLVLGILLWLPIRIEMSRWPLVELTYAGVNLLALATIVVHAGPFETHVESEGASSERALAVGNV